MENGYFIPQESNILVFNATKMNSGSGGWWLYGEDNKYYYALNPFGGYLKLQKGNEPSDFDKFNYETWRIKIPFTDTRDRKIYNTVKIGEQVWMAENLKFEAGGSKCFGNEPKNCNKYGRLYNWETAKTACPDYWHLPTNEEWDILYHYADSTIAADCFFTLPGGYGISGDNYIGNFGGWWSANEANSEQAYNRVMNDYDETAYLDWHDKSLLFSVRCLHGPTDTPHKEAPKKPIKKLTPSSLSSGEE